MIIFFSFGPQLQQYDTNGRLLMPFHCRWYAGRRHGTGLISSRLHAIYKAVHVLPDILAKECNMKRLIMSAAIGAVALAVPASAALADSISSVEGARAKERAGYYTTRQEDEKLNRYGGNDHGYRSYGYSYGDYDYGYDGYSSGGVSVYVGPSY